MNQTLQLLMARKSVRAYEPRPIAQSDREAILAATLRAPTAGNMMLYAVIEITDQSVKDHLAESCDHQPFIARAPWLLLFCADFQRWYDYFVHCGAPQLGREMGKPSRKPDSGDLLLAANDALIAAQTAVMAAESLSIGSCYIGDILERFEEHQQLLSLPRYVLPITLVCFGYPTEAQKNRKQTPRFAERYLLHRDRYRRLSTEELEACFAERAASVPELLPGARNLGQHIYLRRFVSDFSIEMSRSVNAMLKSWSEQE